MQEILSTLLKNQEQNIFKLGQNLFFNKKAKCPRCTTKVFLHHTGKSNNICFFCNNCQCLFEKK